MIIYPDGSVRFYPNEAEVQVWKQIRESEGNTLTADGAGGWTCTYKSGNQEWRRPGKPGVYCSKSARETIDAMCRNDEA